MFGTRGIRIDKRMGAGPLRGYVGPVGGPIIDRDGPILDGKGPLIRVGG